MTGQAEYHRWCEKATLDGLQQLLRQMDDSEKQDAFYRDLAFGTGGLRGVIGAGTNRMNVYTVAKATQGLANYLLGKNTSPCVVIGYDSRLKSDLFARTAAGVFAASGVQVRFWPTLNPVSTVSFGVRQLQADAGVMITASHNPSKYNGYKVYGADGCQITTKAADDILSEIEKIDIFADIRWMEWDEARKTGAVQLIDGAVMDAFLQQVKAQSVLYGDAADRACAIVYSPLNGTGLVPVTRILRESGFANVTVVEAQRLPDGNFPTCPYPNPEIRQAMELGIATARQTGADLLLATDPDCDRVGIALREEDGEYRLLTGNETGMLLLDYLCSQRQRHGTLPADPVLVKTVVTVDMAEKIAAHYGLSTINVLTGFKFIGEKIGQLEAAGEADRYVFGFEESYGYLSGGYVRDKDGVGAAFLICEMFAFYRAQGVSLVQKLAQLYQSYGSCINTLHSYAFEGAAGFTKMQQLMALLRARAVAGGKLAGHGIMTVTDYAPGIEGLPPSDVLKIRFADDCSMVVRPSGTEPKLKLYLSAVRASREDAAAINTALKAGFEALDAALPAAAI